MLQTLASVPWTDILLWTLVVVLVGLGIAGTIIPAIPGHPLIFAGGWLAGWIGNYQSIGGWTIGILGGLAVIGFAVDWVSQTMGAKRAGASKYGTAGALIGTVLGLSMGFVGIFFMPLVGAFAGEFIAQKNLKTATSVGWATWVGMIVGSAIKVAIAFVMAGIILVRAL